jgi:DNA-binding XRE family transcriptional regulator
MAVAERKRKPKRTPAQPKPAAGNPWPAALKRLRVEIGEREGLGRSLLQSEAAARLGVSRRSWIAWEVGTQIPSSAHAKLIPFVFQITID